jgi:hypothetical protein
VRLEEAGLMTPEPITRRLYHFSARCLLPALLFSGLASRASAQACRLSPADCPAAGLEYARSDSIRIGNGLLPREVAMQDAMRTLVTRMIRQAGERLHWDVTELDEVTNLGPLQSASTPYAQRSPRGFGIAFQFIVSDDSLRAWRQWMQDFNRRYRQAGAAGFKDAADAQSSPLYAQYNDSVQHYLKLRLAYEDAHPHAIGDEDKYLIMTQKKQNEFLQKMQDMINGSGSGDGPTLDQLDEEKRTQTLRFRNAALVQVFFEFNGGFNGIREDDAVVETHPLSVPEAAGAVRVRVTNPAATDPWHFADWPNMSVVWLGKWLPPRDNANAYAAFTRNGQDDEHTPKRVKSDEVQTIVIHMMGEQSNCERLLPQLDMNALNAVIVKK